MAIRTIYYQNTNLGHAKDYWIVVDDSALIITTRWGKIGRPKTENTVLYGNIRALSVALAKHMSKRDSRGYYLVHDSVTGSAGMVATPIVSTASAFAPEVSRSTLLADIREMERAERM